MKLQFVGTGSAFCMNNYQTNMLVENNGRNLLIDAGGDLRFSLKEVGLTYLDIDAIYITHLHADHIGGLEWAAFTTYFDPRAEDKILLIGNNELIRELWNHSLEGGLKSIQGKKTTLDDFFDVMMVKRNGKFVWEDINFRIVQSVHIMDEYSIVPSFGIMFQDDNGRTIYYTGDTQFNPNQIMDFYKQADLIIQDCETMYINNNAIKSGVHAHYEELKTLPDNIKSKMLLQHYQDSILEKRSVISKEWNEKAKKDGFMGLPDDSGSYGFIPQGFSFDTKVLKNVRTSKA